MIQIQRTLCTRIIISALFAAVAAGAWDAWWHGALGRESFWSPPHLFLYAAVLVAIGTGWYAWYSFRELLWKRAALILALIPLSAPLDDFWHRFFGVENIASPVIVWSPPHLLIIFSIIASFAMLLPILRRDEDRDAQHLFGSMAFAGILMLLFFVVSPLEPTGPHHLLGFWGAGIAAMVFAGVLLAAQRSIPGLAAATLTALFFVTLVAIGFGEKVALNVIVTPHDHPPAWLTVFSLMIPALFLDVLNRQPLPIKGEEANAWSFRKTLSISVLGKRKVYCSCQGMVAGFLWSFLLFGFSSFFFEPQFQYATTDAVVAI